MNPLTFSRHFYPLLEPAVARHAHLTRSMLDGPTPPLIGQLPVSNVPCLTC